MYFNKFIIGNIDYKNIEGSKQALGLMTKQVTVELKDSTAEDEENFDFSNFNPDEVLTNKVADIYSSKFDYSLPPDEDFLTNYTLWPENTKLYGHGYEIISVAASHDGKIIASGGKAQSEKHSKLFIWSVEKRNLLCKLDGHVLTIVQIEFSHNDEYILTVSRDRSVCIYKKNNDEISPYQLAQIEKETHGRIIWGCSWSHDDKIFITGSRDKTIKIWQKTDSGEKLFEEVLNHEFAEAVTSVNFIPIVIKNHYIAIIGFEDGVIQFHSVNLNTDNKQIKQISTIHPFLIHGSTIKRIKSFVTDTQIVRIATCSDDYSTRIFEVCVPYLESHLE
jgi:elongator complex protein 2